MKQGGPGGGGLLQGLRNKISEVNNAKTIANVNRNIVPGEAGCRTRRFFSFGRTKKSNVSETMTALILKTEPTRRSLGSRTQRNAVAWSSNQKLSARQAHIIKSRPSKETPISKPIRVAR
jgi:hypothetical protein